MASYLILLNGVAGCGKDTFVEFCSQSFKSFGVEVHNISAVDQIKEWAKIMGWDGTKDDRGRKLLSDLKLLSIGFNDGPMKYLESKVMELDGAVFVHCREPEEIKKFVTRFPKTITILLKRPNTHTPNNISDKSVEQFDYSEVVLNDGSLEDLKSKATAFVEDFVRQV